MIKTLNILNAYTVPWEIIHQGLSEFRVSRAVVETYASNILCHTDDELALAICVSDRNEKILHVFESRGVGQKRNNDFWRFIVVLEFVLTKDSVEDPEHKLRKIYEWSGYPVSLESILNPSADGKTLDHIDSMSSKLNDWIDERRSDPFACHEPGISEEEMWEVVVEHLPEFESSILELRTESNDSGIHAAVSRFAEVVSTCADEQSNRIALALCERFIVEGTFSVAGAFCTDFLEHFDSHLSPDVLGPMLGQESLLYLRTWRRRRYRKSYS